MANEAPRFEGADLQGGTLQASGTVGTTPVNVPAVAGGLISEFLIQCPEDQSDQYTLQVSLDGGSNYLTMYPGGAWAWTPKGDIRQITLLGNDVAGVAYEVVLNREVD